MNTSRKCVRPLQIVYAYLASGGFAPDLHIGALSLDPAGDFRPPSPLCPPYLQTLVRQPDSTRFTFFYRAMHYSAKRGLPITYRLSVRPSVRLSVRLVDHDHIAGKSWKLIAQKLAQHLRSS